jgi:hypothetical protein
MLRTQYWVLITEYAWHVGVLGSYNSLGNGLRISMPSFVTT